MRKSQQKGNLIGFQFILFVFGIFFVEIMAGQNKPTFQEKEMKADFVLAIGSEKTNEDFFQPKYFTLDKNGNIYILDSGNSRIQVFSPQGRFIFSFGRFGQGPGELSKDASIIKILEDNRVYVIDNMQRRINIYDEQGKYFKSFALRSEYDDIVLVENRYYLSNLLLKEDYKPIYYAEDLADIRNSFGRFIEPTPEITKRIKKSPIPLETEFAHRNMTSLLADSKGTILYSQLEPYHLIQYDKNGRMINDIIGDVGFDTHFPLELSFGDQTTTHHVTSPPATVFAPIPIAGDRFMVAILRPDRSSFVLDFYEKNGSMIRRYIMKNDFFDPSAKRTGITNLYIDGSLNIYGLVVSQEDNPVLKKYHLIVN